jgi:AcrR family transcriptional regulator
MPYEVTKRIKGRDYRYRVEATRWTYLGRVTAGDVLAPARHAPRRVSRDEIVAITAKLIESRDVSRVTVGVIAQHAGIAPGTFYRHFDDRDAVLGEAIALLADRALRGLPSLAAPIGTLEAERARLNRWFEGVHAAVLRGRAFRWFLTSTSHDKLVETIRRTSVHGEPRDVLAAYFAALDAAGLARIPDPPTLAAGMMTMHASIVRDMALHDDADAAARWAVIFPVIERAVFGSA